MKISIILCIYLNSFQKGKRWEKPFLRQHDFSENIQSNFFFVITSPNIAKTDYFSHRGEVVLRNTWVFTSQAKIAQLLETIAQLLELVTAAR